MVKSAEIRMLARQRCFDLSIMPFYDLHRDLKGRLMVLRDITARRDAEEELEQYRSHLEEMVAERTAELQAANERMQVLSSVKDEFIANISHELRTPITSLKLYHHLLAERPDRLMTYVATLRGETERLERIVDDLLYLSQIEQGDITPIFASVDLNVLVKDCVAARMALVDRNGLTLTLSQEAGLPPVQADSALLERVLSTLLMNAFSYTPKGGQISIRIYSHESDGKSWVGLGVGDTGPGIPPEELPRLFERFFRGRIALEAGVPGIGLGLAISKEIIERHGGRIEAASEGVPGKGATFTVWLPVSRAG
jgi:signal transduction histidine kinase